MPGSTSSWATKQQTHSMANVSTSKRRKTLLACENCRRHKIKCDGERPVCGNCARRGRTTHLCIWKHVDGRPTQFEDTNATASFVQQLERRIEQLERQAPSVSPSSYAAAPSARTIIDSGSVGPAASLPESLAGISAMEGAVTGVPQSEGFIGSASAASFMSLIRQAVDPSSAAAAAPQAQSSPRARDATFSSTSRKPPRVHFLPLRQKAERLAVAYWDYIHPLYPFLYKPHFGIVFRSLWTGEVPSEARSSLMRMTEANSECMVSLVLALACQYYDSSGDGEDASQGSKSGAAFFDQARSVFQHKIADGTDHSLQFIQILLLMAQYLNSTGSTQKSWEVMGLAIRICQGLGLHRGATSHEKAMADPVEREMTKRVWHGCITVERQAARAVLKLTRT